MGSRASDIRQSPDRPLDYLTHDEFPVDEPVWLTPEDAAAGRDTARQAALSWIGAQGTTP